GGIMHCFTGDEQQARQALDRGFHLAFGGVLTFPKAGAVRDAARLTPADRLLVELNEPAFLVEKVRGLAEVRSCAPEGIARQTTDNFRRLCLRGRAGNG